MSANICIVGLGNPGKKYELNRHNMGFLVIQAFAKQEGWHFKEDKQLFVSATKGRVQETTVHLVMPMTYMNESGRAVRHYLDFFKLTPDELIVVSDDVMLPYGEMRLRSKGSAGGHNGLKSIQAHIGTSEYARLRMGIGLGEQAVTLADHVLDNFTKEEMASLPDFIQRGLTVLNSLISESFTHVMNTVNTKIKQNIRPHEEGQEK